VFALPPGWVRRRVRLVQSVGRLGVDNPARSLRRGRVPGRQGGVESSRSLLFKLLNLLFDSTSRCSHSALSRNLTPSSSSERASPRRTDSRSAANSSPSTWAASLIPSVMRHSARLPKSPRSWWMRGQRCRSDNRHGDGLTHTELVRPGCPNAGVSSLVGFGSTGGARHDVGERGPTIRRCFNRPRTPLLAPLWKWTAKVRGSARCRRGDAIAEHEESRTRCASGLSLTAHATGDSFQTLPLQLHLLPACLSTSLRGGKVLASAAQGGWRPLIRLPSAGPTAMVTGSGGLKVLLRHLQPGTQPCRTR
jgi:hypothetical protein